MPYGALAPLKLAGVYSAILKYGGRAVSEPVYVSKTSNNQVSLLSRMASRALGLVTLNFLNRDIHLVTRIIPYFPIIQTSAKESVATRIFTLPCR